MLDVNCAWSVPVACDMAAALAGEGLTWLEEPVWPPEDAHGLAQVRGYGIPISAGENVAGVFGFRALIEAGAIDIAQPSVTKIGGIGEMLRVIALCHANGVEVFPHSPYFGPGFLASVHICAALIERPLVEVLWLDMEANPFDPWVRTENGKVKGKFPVVGVMVTDFAGKSLMIHAGGDNYSDTPKPLGGGGERVVCGVVPGEPGTTPAAAAPAAPTPAAPAPAAPPAAPGAGAKAK